MKTTEVVIGKWTDGRPIYRKVVNLGSGPNSTNKSVASGISNLDFLLNLYGGAVAGGGVSRIFPISISSTSGSTTVIGAVKMNGSDIYWSTTYNATGETGYAVLEYIKT